VGGSLPSSGPWYRHPLQRGGEKRQVARPKIVPFQKGRAFKKSLDSLEEKNNGKCTGSVAKTSRTEKKKVKIAT